MNAFTVSTSTFFSPASSPSSRIQYPCSFSGAALSFMSPMVRESLNHLPPSLAKNELLPMPCGPFSTTTLSNFTPGRYTRATAATIILRATARV